MYKRKRAGVALEVRKVLGRLVVIGRFGHLSPFPIGSFLDQGIVGKMCDTLIKTNVLVCRYVRGADPIIKLMDEDGDVLETLAIDKWNTDSVEEFLNTYLILPGQEEETMDRSANEI